MKGWIAQNWRELFIRFALVFYCLALWPRGLFYWSIGFLVLAWVMDGGISKFFILVKEPFVRGILVFCGVWLLGLLWSDFSVAVQGDWKKYFLLLTFIPLRSLLNKSRLPWVIGALLGGYFSTVALGSYQWAVQGMQGIPLLHIVYLPYSAALGAGVILAVYFGLEAHAGKKKYLAVLLWLMALSLLFLQFNQSSRGMLLATVITLVLIVILRFWMELKKLAASFIFIAGVMVLFAASSDVFQERLRAIDENITSFQEGSPETSIGYRLAMWDVGLHGIAQHPFLGLGSGMPAQYFEESILTYKQGIYKNLPKFLETTHYHNELLEITLHLGLLGLLSFIFFLWSWFQEFKRYKMALLGGAVVCFVLICGLTEVFLIFSRVPRFLLAVTAIAICWQENNEASGAPDLVNPNRGNRDQSV